MSRSSAPKDGVIQRRIAYMWLPSFGVKVAFRSDHRLAARPLVLLDDQERVLDADTGAARRGVLAGMPQRAAAARCPDACFAPAARYPIQEAQEALWAQVKLYTDRWQPDGLGRVYLDISRVGSDVLSWCQALAGALRTQGWEPALGATGSKFGAAVAGQVAGERTALFMIPSAQRPFLAMQPVSALPLEAEALQQLRYLGIRTLGQYTRLPASGIMTRFGAAGRTAQLWALGLDDRPVVPPWEAPEVTAHVECEPPLADRQRLLAVLTRHAERLLGPLRERFQAVSRILLLITCADGRVVPAGYVFPQPTAAAGPMRLGLEAVLDRVAWGQPAAELTLTLAGITDAPCPQLTLFELNLDSRTRLHAVLDRLSARYGADAFHLAVLTDPDNPLPEQRVSWRPFSE